MAEIPGPHDYGAPNYMESYWTRIKEDAERLAVTATRELAKLQERDVPQLEFNLNDDEGLLIVDHSTE